MTAARSWITETVSMQDTLDRLDEEGFDLFQVISLGGARHLVIGVPRPVVADQELSGPRADWSPVDGSR